MQADAWHLPPLGSRLWGNDAGTIGEFLDDEGQPWEPVATALERLLAAAEGQPGGAG